MRINVFISALALVLAAGCSESQTTEDQKQSEEPRNPAKSNQTIGAAEELNSSEQFGYAKKLASLVPPVNSVEIPYYVILGGNHSCRRSIGSSGQESPYATPIFNNFVKNLLDATKSNLYPMHYLISCYTKARQVLFSTSHSPEEIIPAQEQTIRDVILSQTLPGQRIIIVGHSYGGWLAMQLSIDLLSLRTIERLFTIDPISALECGPKAIVGCQRAPADIGPYSVQYLSSTIGRWENYYQLTTKILHSGPISGAHLNQIIDASHITIHHDQGIWQRVFSL